MIRFGMIVWVLVWRVGWYGLGEGEKWGEFFLSNGGYVEVVGIDVKMIEVTDFWLFSFKSWRKGLLSFLGDFSSLEIGYVYSLGDRLEIWILVVEGEIWIYGYRWGLRKECYSRKRSDFRMEIWGILEC